MGLVTRPQFDRLLTIIGIVLGERDIDILVKKFEDQCNGRIHYRDFLRIVDPVACQAQ